MSGVDFKGKDFELIPFGSGRRMCPAMNMGVVAVELSLANILHCFDGNYLMVLIRKRFCIHK